MSNSIEHNETVRREFTSQATAYASNPVISDRERIDRFFQAVHPSSAACVLDLATGPGYVAMYFAERCREVTGIDLTAAPLELANRMRDQRDQANLRFEQGDVARLPFSEGSFDVVICRFALHHMLEPRAALAEMARVCRAGGVAAVEDLVVSEHTARGAYQNRVETLRDSSHVRALPLSELLILFAREGLEVEAVYTSQLTPVVEQWIANAHTPPERASEVRELVEDDEKSDLSGMRPFRRAGQLAFTQRTGAVIGRKL
ncbi:MAG: class I SAM-dependent methyltransferase [Chloroflexota bacterium]